MYLATRPKLIYEPLDVQISFNKKAPMSGIGIVGGKKKSGFASYYGIFTIFFEIKIPFLTLINGCQVANVFFVGLQLHNPVIYSVVKKIIKKK